MQAVIMTVSISYPTKCLSTACVATSKSSPVIVSGTYHLGMKIILCHRIHDGFELIKSWTFTVIMRPVVL